MIFVGELGKVEANWFDADTYEGQCVKRISQGVWEAPDSGIGHWPYSHMAINGYIGHLWPYGHEQKR